MLVFNWVGIGLLMLWTGMLALTLKITQARLHVLMGMLLGCLVVAAVDMILRLVVMKQNSVRLPILHPRTGGHLFFVPVWILATVVGAFGLVLFLRGS